MECVDDEIDEVEYEDASYGVGVTKMGMVMMNEERRDHAVDETEEVVVKMK